MGSWIRVGVYFREPVRTDMLNEFMQRELNTGADDSEETTDGILMSANRYGDSASSLYRTFQKLPVDFEMLVDDGNNVEDTGTISYAADSKNGLIKRTYDECGTYPSVDLCDKDGTIRKVMEAPNGRECHVLPDGLLDPAEGMPEADLCGLLAAAVKWPASATAPRTVGTETGGQTLSAVYAPKKLLSELPLGLTKFADSMFMTAGPDRKPVDDRSAIIELGRFAIVCMLMDDAQVRRIVEGAPKTNDGTVSRKEPRFFTGLDLLVNGRYCGLYAKAGKGNTCQIAIGFCAPEYMPENARENAVPAGELLSEISKRMAEEGTPLTEWLREHLRREKR